MWRSFWVFGLVLLTACSPPSAADRIFFNGTIYTLHEEIPVAEAMVVQAGKIVAVGAEKELRMLYHPAEEIDLQGQFVYPGFIDAHCHFPAYARSLLTADLRTAQSEQELLELLEAWYQVQLKNGIQLNRIDGWGWDQNNWPGKQMPNRLGLDSLFPNIPVVLHRVDGHAALVNRAALKAFQICCPKPIDGGWMGTMGDSLSGLLVDNAMNLIPETQLDSAFLLPALQRAEQHLFAHGLTGLHDAGLFLEEWQQLRAWLQQGHLQMPISVMAADDSANFNFLQLHGPVVDDRFWLRSAKFYADGALGSRGALLLEPYHDDHDRFGLAVRPPAYLEKHYQWMHALGIQVCTHAIGDSANRTVLQLYAKILAEPNDKRWRVEHAQVVHQDDRHFFADFHIVPSVQPTHATSDGDWAEERLGADRMARAYAYKSLSQALGRLPLGTDFPIEDIDPLKTFYAAVARRDFNGWPEEGFHREEALTREQALRGMTLDAAWAQFREEETGSLVPGKWADMVVLNADLLEMPEEDIPQAQIISTWIRGEEVFSNKGIH